MFRRIDVTAAGLMAAALFTLLACLPINREVPREVFQWIAIVDITRSMNVADYQLEGRPASRLDFVKAALRHAIASMPCGSRMGLGVFTEREPAMLFMPVEVCSDFAVLDGTIAQLDWRMAWAADSRIADGLRNSLDLLKDADAAVAFFSDGQEAPPVNPRYRADLSGYRGKAKAMLVGVGSLTPSPIPKFDEAGKPTGVYGADEVPQRSTFGLSELAPEQIEGYHARNAPFGKAPEGGTEHLSSLKEDYLRDLAAQAGLNYHRLERPEGLAAALQQTGSGRIRPAATDLRPVPAALAWLALVASYLWKRAPWGRRQSLL
jgi:mxaL protein